MEYDIFISYSREDSDIVNIFVSRLADAGYNVWIDREEIHPSDRLEKRIAEAIRNSAIVLFFSSFNSNDSVFVLREICYAIDKEKTIIPIQMSNDEYAECIADDLVDVDYIVLQSVTSTIKKIISFLSDYLGKTPSFMAPNPDLKDKSSEELFNLGQSSYDNKNYEQAVEYYESAAMKGHAGAQYSLGCCYHSGEGVTIDYPEAARWYRKAAKQGHVWAQHNLGYCYESGEGVCHNDKEAFKWYYLAAVQGFAESQFCLGNCYDFGKGVHQDDKEALEWYYKAATQGHELAQFIIATFYERGQGVTKNYETALYWYRKSAEQGYAEAQYCLALYYESGTAVSKDMNEAIKLYRLAAEKGFLSAKDRLKELGVL